MQQSLWNLQGLLVLDGILFGGFILGVERAIRGKFNLVFRFQTSRMEKRAHSGGHSRFVFAGVS